MLRMWTKTIIFWIQIFLPMRLLWLSRMQSFSTRTFIRVKRGNAVAMIWITYRIQIHYIVSSEQTAFRLLVWNVKSLVLNNTIPLSQKDYSDITLVQPLAPLTACSNSILLNTLVLNGFYLQFPSGMSVLPSNIVVVGKNNFISSGDWYFHQSDDRIYFYPTYTKAGSYLIDIYVFNTLYNTEEITTMIVSSPLETPQYYSWGSGIIGGMSGETLSFYVVKYDAYGNAMYYSLIIIVIG